jgi:hypothetical protein
MARREREAGRSALNAPFADLKKRLRARPAPPRPRPAPAPAPPEEPADVFATAMAGVRPLRRGVDRRVETPAPAGRGRPPVSEEAETLAILSDLVDGTTHFDISDTREYVEGAIVGMTSETARIAVDRFLGEAVGAGHRCVLIVHGRGRNSKDQTPVLKERLKVWLARGKAARIVLGFTTARPCDGGAGALYVLLRRDRTRRPIRVIEGAKR